MNPLHLIVFLIIAKLSLSQSDTINQKDQSGKQGFWIYYGKDRPNLNYPDSAKVEEGRYVNDRKEGLWKKFNPDGTLRIEGVYKNNRPVDTQPLHDPDYYRYSHCDNKPYDSLIIHLNYGNCFGGPVTSEYLMFYPQTDSLAAYIDSLCLLGESFQAPHNIMCSSGLDIEITRFSNGTTCRTLFNTCRPNSEAARIAEECAERVFHFNY